MGYVCTNVRTYMYVYVPMYIIIILCLDNILCTYVRTYVYMYGIYRVPFEETGYPYSCMISQAMSGLCTYIRTSVLYPTAVKFMVWCIFHFRSRISKSKSDREFFEVSSIPFKYNTVLHVCVHTPAHTQPMLVLLGWLC